MRLSALTRRWRRAEDGAVAVEFALLAPILFSLLFGIACVGYFMALSHSVNQLAASTARASVSGITAQERRILAEAYLARAGQNYPLLDTAALTPTVLITTDPMPQIDVQITYALDTSMLSLANGFLGMNLSHIEGGAYLAY